jgi:hypothetical protein
MKDKIQWTHTLTQPSNTGQSASGVYYKTKINKTNVEKIA